jgi:hypothetical protein
MLHVEVAMRIPHCSMKTGRVANLFVRGLACTAIAATAESQVGPWRISRASLDASGGEIPVQSLNPAISASSNLVTFATVAALLPADMNGAFDLYLVDTSLGTLELVSATSTGASGNQETTMQADFSDDDRMVAFMSRASDLVPGLSDDYHA